jgi:hypothetical protein
MDRKYEKVKEFAQKQWDRKYEKVQEFAQKHGHLNLQLPGNNPETRRLGTWMRQELRKEHIPDYQKQKWSNLNVYMDKNKLQARHGKEEDVWSAMYNKLVAYHREKGHLVVSKLDQSPSNLQLYSWMAYQRQRAKQRKLSAERKRKLDAIGFDFLCGRKRETKSSFTEEQDKQWNMMYAQLVEFHKVHGHCRVIYSYEANPPLGGWVSKQRTNLKRDVMDQERKDRLDQLQFTWNVQDYLSAIAILAAAGACPVESNPRTRT